MSYTYTTRSMAHFALPIAQYVANNMDENGNHYDIFDMTLEEAILDVDWWRGYADTVGGDACVVRNDGEIYAVPYNIKDFYEWHPELATVQLEMSLNRLRDEEK